MRASSEVDDDDGDDDDDDDDDGDVDDEYELTTSELAYMKKLREEQPLHPFERAMLDMKSQMHVKQGQMDAFLTAIHKHLGLTDEQKKVVPPLYRHLDKRLLTSKAKYIKVYHTHTEMHMHRSRALTR
jgi:hypothetical protein